MDIKIQPCALSGHVAPVDSKSHAHRLLIAAFLSEIGGRGAAAKKGRACEVRIGSTNKDIEATKSCLAELYAARAEGRTAKLNCGESGSTLRFLLPVSAALCESAEFYGEGRLPERPLEPLLSEMQRNGVSVLHYGDKSRQAPPPSGHALARMRDAAVLSSDFAGGSSSLSTGCAYGPEGERHAGKNDNAEKRPFLKIENRLQPGVYELPGNVSSQFITGLLFALPLLEGESEIRLTSPLESAGYVNMTLSVLRQFGIQVEAAEEFIIPAPQSYDPPAAILLPEADWSAAAFWVAAGRLGVGNHIMAEGLPAKTTQGDSAIRDLAKRIEALRESDETLKIDVSQIPDLLPILSVLAASRRKGRTEFINAARLRIKESDRIEASEAMIKALGGRAESGQESLSVFGTEGLSGGTVDGKNDHRIVMSAAIASTMCRGEVTIKGAEAAEKSYPRFWEDFAELGGKYAKI